MDHFKNLKSTLYNQATVHTLSHAYLHSKNLRKMDYTIYKQTPDYCMHIYTILMSLESASKHHI